METNIYKILTIILYTSIIMFFIIMVSSKTNNICESLEYDYKFYKGCYKSNNINEIQKYEFLINQINDQYSTEISMLISLLLIGMIII